MTQLNDGFEIKTKMKVNTCYSCKKTNLGMRLIIECE